jgi:D-3-phosphoglycerate dehydrogenase / 2-oxoglutarate reductase
MAPHVQARLTGLGVLRTGPFNDQTALRACLEDCDVLMVRLGRYIDEDLMDMAPRLRFIVTATTGLDHIDRAAAAARGIRVISLRDCAQLISDVSATAEHAWGLLLALLRHTPAAHEHVLSGGWDRNQFWGSQLRGRRLGILGFGRIGRMVAGYGAAFGMDVVAHDRDPTVVLHPATPGTLDDVVATADVLSVHVTADPANRHLLDDRLIRLMKPGSVFINTARGMIVNAAALADAIRRGRIAGAAVDVLEGEEHGGTAGDPLLACARDGFNVLITPHIGGATLDAIAYTENAVVGVLADVLAAGAAP